MNPAPIFECFSAYQKTAAMQAAVDIGLFSALAKGNVTVADAAKACNASEKGVRILCDYWTVNGILSKTGNAYHLTPEAALFLDQKSPAYIGGVLGFINGPIVPYFAELTESVRRGGRPDAGTVKNEYDGWINFAQQMGAMMHPTAMAIAGILGQLKGSVLDIAAGHGLFGIALAQKNPELKVTALDWPKVLEVAQANAKRMGVGDRYALLPGDAFTVNFGGPHDVALLTNLLHHFNRQQCVALLKRIRAALKPAPHGRLVTLEFIPNADRVSPPLSATFPLVMLATTAEGDAYTFAELESMLREAGFARNTLHQPAESAQQVIVSE